MLTSSKIGNFYKDLAIFFTSYYGCSIIVSQDFFSSFKTTVYSIDGMHLYDCNLTLLNYFKVKNRKSIKQVYFLGNIFEKENPSMFEDNVSFIKYNQFFKRFAILGLTGNIIEPVHFIAIYIDKEILSIFLYNSCPRHINSSRSEKNIIEYLSFWFSDYKIYINEYRQQFGNELCAFFASNFLTEIAYSNNPIQVFNYHNQSLNLDEAIFKKQNNYIEPVCDNLKLIDLFFKSWNIN